jgi:hypothetical protein
VQQYDDTLHEGWYPLHNAVPSSGTATVVAEGYPGYQYDFKVRAHSTAGVVSAWTSVTTTVADTATFPRTYKGLYTQDVYGGLTADGSPPLGVSAYWPGWKIAHTGHALPGASPITGAVLDGFGGLHSYGGPLTFSGGPYWPGWDIARDFAFLPSGTGGYILDAYGGLHSFSVNGKPAPPATAIDTYWGGHDVARKVVIFSDGSGGYVLDVYGGVHAFGIGGARPVAATTTGYWANWNIIRDFVLIPGTHAGYVLDGFGGLHPFTPTGQTMPVLPAISGYWANWDIARAVWLLPGSTPAASGGYVMDGYGGLHPFGSAPAAPPSGYWPGKDVARSLTGY